MFRCKYQYGGSGVFDTSFTLNNIQFHKQRRLPILTFRSMYVSEGNSDCDHINIDGKYDFNIISNWSEISGNTFFFYRKCISKHNTQSLRAKTYLLYP
jgi:hypothetical protein